MREWKCFLWLFNDRYFTRGMGTDEVCSGHRFQLVCYGVWEGVSCLLSVFKSIEDELACVNETFNTIEKTYFCPWVKLRTRLIHAFLLYRKNTSIKPQIINTHIELRQDKITACSKTDDVRMHSGHIAGHAMSSKTN